MQNTPLVKALISLVGLVFFTGCTSVNSVNVTSQPPGARVYNARGRSECGSIFHGFRPYDHVQGTYRGETPVAYRGDPSCRYDNVRVVWPDGEDSGWAQKRNGFFKGSEWSFAFVKSNAVPVYASPVAAKQILPSNLPIRTWQPENIAIVDLTAYTLSQGEAKTLTDKLQTTMVQTQYFKVLSRSDMKQVLDAQKFQRSDACDDTACLVEMGKILAVQKIVGGSIGKVGNTFSLALRLVNVETSQTEITADRKLKAEPDELLDLIEDAGRELALKYAETKKQE